MCIAVINNKLKNGNLRRGPSMHHMMALHTVRVLRISGSARLPRSPWGTVILGARAPTKEYHRLVTAHVPHSQTPKYVVLQRLPAIDLSAEPLGDGHAYFLTVLAEYSTADETDGPKSSVESPEISVSYC